MSLIIDVVEVEQAIRRDGRFSPAAIGFLQHALDRTAREIHGPPPEATRHRPATPGAAPAEAAPSQSQTQSQPPVAAHGSRPARHVSGRQLCEGARRCAIELWGMLAPLVLERWNIRSTRDIGELVFFLIELGLMGRQDSDRIEDFDDVFAFEDAFGNYELALEAEPSRS